MTTLQERCRIAEQCLPDAPYRAMLTKLHDEMLAALAQQGEPVAWMTRYGNVARGDVIKSGIPFDDSEDYTIPLYTAAPAPQPAQANGRTNRGDETGGAVERFGWHIGAGKPKIIPATNGAFVWYSDYLKLWQSAQPLTDDEILTIAHRKATRYTHAVAPWQVTYGFSVTHMIDFVRAIEADNGIREVK